MTEEVADKTATEEEKENSGFTTDLMSEMESDMISMSSARFTNLSPLYESKSGHSMLMTATRYGKRYVLKGLKPEFRYNPTFRLILQKDFEIGLHLDHPNIVQTISFEIVDSIGPVIVLEYIDGETLEELLDRGSISAGRTCSIVSQLSEAVGYMHSKQVIHRDIKPSNIMVTHAGDIVKLIDFSLADSDSFVIIKSQAGTRVYMAPELNYEGAKSNVKTDLYSFGIIVRQLAQTSGSRRLLSIARRCTERNPEKRAGSIRELHIESASQDMPSLSSLISLDSPVVTWILALVAIVFLLVLIIS